MTFAASGRDQPRQGPAGRIGARGDTRYVDPYTGALIEGDGTRGQAFFRTIRSLHRWLTAGKLGNQEIGKQLVGASTLLCVVLTVSGLYLRWPRRANSWRVWLTFNPSLKGRSFLWHLHAVLGTWVLVGFLLMSLTGLYWSYDWYRNVLYALASVERPAPREQRAGSEGAGGAVRTRESRAGRSAGGGELRGESDRGHAEPTSPVDLQAIWAAFMAETARSGFSTATVTLPRESTRPVEIRYVDAKPAHDRANNTIVLDSRTAEIVRHERYDTKHAGEKFMASIFPLHSGKIFGLPGMLAYMVASLAMPVFAVTGWMLYLDRRRRKAAMRASSQALASPH